MARRVARSSVSASKPKTARKKNHKRNLDAFAIAEREVGDRTKIRQHRLGEAEDDNPRRKRQRMESDDEDDDDEPRTSNPRKKAAKGRFDELDVSEGSDSDGNTWRMGEVDEDDDSDIDSDEAFDESDEERFADFTFRGSSTQDKKSKKKAAKPVDEDGDIDLDEDEEQSEEDSDDDSLGSDAVDLAQMLDDYEEEQNKAKSKGKKTRKQQDSDESDDDAEEEEDDKDEDSEASDFQMSDGEDDDRDPGKISQLQDFISTISHGNDAKNKKGRVQDAHEGSAPSEFGVGASQKLDIGDLLAGTNDPNAKKIIKMLKDSKPSKNKGIPGKLEAPLPKRQQDKLDRVAANEKAKETLERWVDTIKQNRRAEHLSFPIRDPDAQEPMGSKILLPLTTAKPANDLESTIQSIMEESGLATGKKSEEQLAEFEELQTNKMPIEEVMARRAELRKARDLLFREEVRSKRLKKIKSKSYRRVHRKERERLEEQERQALAEAGVDISDDERERNDRRRAEERMGAKHRESKWAKSMKATGRAAWDDDARDGLNEMARRNEELRRRIEGKDVRDEDGDATDLTSESDADDDDDSDAGDVRRLKRQLDRVDAQNSANAGGLSKLAGLKFMQRAEAAQKARNDEDTERIRRELATEDGEDEEGEDDDQPQSTGRKVFGPSSNKPAQPIRKPIRNEFEEQPGSDDEADADDEVKFVLDNKDQSSASRKKQPALKNGDRNRKAPAARQQSEEPEDNPWIEATTKDKKLKSKSRQATSSGLEPTLDVVSGSKTSDETKRPKAKAIEAPAPADADGWTTVTYRNQEGSDDESDQEPENPFVLRKESLVEKAFAGDEVANTFEAEKRAIEEDEGDKIIDNTLPGWGSWTGNGVSKRDKKRNTGRFLTTQKGVDKEKRKDAKLKNVVINEKRVKKNAKYLASSLPFPHQSKQVYESTLRRPLGPEFNTKEVFQDSTKPRVMVKPGVVIKPLAKPLV
ncbi:putative small nucleolar ribonucleoprotein complex subunit utp14 protein [Neofusicoccum parvum UCRNP2]|uniref:Putative small nucleolar ribonucleoprotein complex subunit utp14 protein n=1 Tax=Botryosphaeria parva (strain UCR-NP2) TaxID=1287680 RepID=R1GEW8_BOTPV|nr:putative small nucleolar ribonucleoprotein complex subunit utp14 protein [Neofusicoccum parvum UCRNP2]